MAFVLAVSRCEHETLPCRQRKRPDGVHNLTRRDPIDLAMRRSPFTSFRKGSRWRHEPTLPTLDPLFGAGIQFTDGWSRHGFEGLKIGFWAMIRRIPRLVAFAVTTGWRADPIALPIVVIAQLLQGLVTASGLVAANQVLVGLLAAGPTSQRLRSALPALLVMATVGVAGSLLRAVTVAGLGRLAPKVERLSEEELLKRTTHVELATIEDSEFHRLLSSARMAVPSTRQLLTGSLSVLNSLMSLVGAAGVMGALHPILLPLLIGTVVPAGWRAVCVARDQHASTKRWLDHTRQQNVLTGLLTERGAAAEELRVHGLAEFFLAHHRRLAGAHVLERSRLSRAEAFGGLLSDALSGLARGATYVALGMLLISGTMPLAVASTAVIAVRTATSNLTAVLTQINQLYEHGLFITDYHKALEQAESHKIPTEGLPVPYSPTEIRLRGVRFAYSPNTQPAVDGVDLDIRRGEVVALVGANGSGKTTLARLIAGLHLPQHGTISWDGIDARDLDRASLFSHIAVIGQDFKQWPVTARVNVTLGRTDAPNPEERLAQAAALSGAEQLTADLPDGWDTLLAREFYGGVNLSGGQWQRLALARARYRQAHILICDEPTAALDPKAEAETFDKLMGLADEGRTVVLITHRLASVRRADRIYVLAHGHIAEHGTHDQLIAAGGLFADMYETQRRQFA
ncbi:ABC transporter ATP-binding protein/permease (plasmid) [Streptomyces sp. NBC_00289]|uniref:ABC transporter ATP-binding protein n=1 Tax=Streptomyces sp. NBC_00289 TaxID=2975703 RepID=UPI00325593DF